MNLLSLECCSYQRFWIPLTLIAALALNCEDSVSAQGRLLTPDLFAIDHANDNSRIPDSTVRSSPSRLSGRPYVLILPGILGEQIWDRRIGQGLVQSGLEADIEIYDWTRGPMMMVANIGGDGNEVTKLIHSIQKFKQLHPQRPLTMIGHSGGCRMVVRVLESLRDDALVDRAILLSPGLESSYDIGVALDNTQQGIVSYYSPLDFPISAPLTFARGLTQMRLDRSAATFGFEHSRCCETTDRQDKPELVQLTFRPDMLSTGNTGGHFGWTVPRFVAQHIVPWLR